jgi:YbbR domain-containing protein
VPIRIDTRNAGLAGYSLMLSAPARIPHESDVPVYALLDVTVRGRAAQVRALRLEDIIAYADISSVDLSLITSEHTFDARIIVPSPGFGISVVHISEEFLLGVTLDLQELQRIPVTVRSVGTIAESHISRFRTEPTMIEIRGPREKVLSITAAEVRVSVEGLTSSRNLQLLVDLYDADGNAINKQNPLLTLQDNVQVFVDVLKYKTVSLRVPLIGHIPGLTVEPTVSFEPREITIMGPPRLIDGISVIELPQIDVSRLSGVYYLNDIRIPLPEGVEVLERIEALNISVTIPAMQERNLVLDRSAIFVNHIPEGFSVEVETVSLNVPIRGDSTELALVASHNLRGDVDMRGVNTGAGAVHNVPVRITILNFPNLQEVGQMYVYIRLIPIPPG